MRRRRRRRLTAVTVVVLALFGASIAYRTAISGSDRNGLAANAALACVQATHAVNEFRAGARSASSTRVLLTDAEQTLQAAAERFAGYSDIVRSVGAVRDDVRARPEQLSPYAATYLNAVCGSPTSTHT